MPLQDKAYTVSAITRMIKANLEGAYQGIWVEGEISGYLHHSSGHRYLTLKDDKAVIKVTIWRSVGGRLKFEPENGQKVLVYGDISVYEKGGNYQLNCRRMEPVGIGELELAFRQLHEKLKAEGLFDSANKQPLPDYPTTIGLVTSPTGAAVRDMIKVAQRRNDAVRLIIHPAQVQGDGAGETIAAGIRYFNTRDDIDIIITGRGGGSLEDLWPFNTEPVVRAIAESHIPIISAVGHEIDTTLSDLAADVRAATPSVAAELAVWSKDDFLDEVNAHVLGQAHQLNVLVTSARRNLTATLSRPIFQRPLDLVTQRQQYIDSLERLLQAAGKNCFDVYRNRLSLVLSKLDTLSPLKILSRGYSVTRRATDGSVLTSVATLKPGDTLETILSEGRAVSVVESITEQTGSKT